MSETRQRWQIEQGARCGCRGSDDMCPCQNVAPGEAPATRAEVEAALRALLRATDHRTPIDVLARAQQRARAVLGEKAP